MLTTFLWILAISFLFSLLGTAKREILKAWYELDSLLVHPTKQIQEEKEEVKQIQSDKDEYYIRVNFSWLDEDDNFNFLLSEPIRKYPYHTSITISDLTSAIKSSDAEYTLIGEHEVIFNEDKCRYEHELSGDFYHYRLKKGTKTVVELITTEGINFASNEEMLKFVRRKPAVSELKSLDELETEFAFEEFNEDPLVKEINALEPFPEVTITNNIKKALKIQDENEAVLKALEAIERADAQSEKLKKKR